MYNEWNSLLEEEGLTEMEEEGGEKESDAGVGVEWRGSDREGKLKLVEGERDVSEEEKREILN